MAKQHTSQVLMVKPIQFAFNPETAVSNAFQQQQASTQIQAKALAEFDAMVNLLRNNGVEVWVVEDTPEPFTPDSVFPNNWISMHENGMVGIYPMQAENRRLERRADILNQLGEHFQLYDIADYSAFEQQAKYLEGTGSMVLDRVNNLCYACLSPRTDMEVLQQFCRDFNYRPVVFDALDQSGRPVYHTNVVMCVGTRFMVVCMESIPDAKQRQAIRDAAKQEIVEITLEQMNHFAGNMLELVNKQGETLLVMSEQAKQALHPQQLEQLQRFARIISSPLDTIETNGGGSARCMIAEIFLPPKNTTAPASHA